jgi:hypothetical protein
MGPGPSEGASVAAAEFSNKHQPYHVREYEMAS